MGCPESCPPWEPTLSEVGHHVRPRNHTEPLAQYLKKFAKHWGSAFPRSVTEKPGAVKPTRANHHLRMFSSLMTFL